MHSPLLHCQNFADSPYTGDITVLCDSQGSIPKLLVSSVVAAIAMYGDHWLAWLLSVATTSFHCSHWIVKSRWFCKFGVGGICNWQIIGELLPRLVQMCYRAATNSPIAGVFG